jgi:hypothetical protein
MRSIVRHDATQIRDPETWAPVQQRTTDVLRCARGTSVYRTTPDMNPALRRGGLMSFFRKQCASLPT